VCLVSVDDGFTSTDARSEEIEHQGNKFVRCYEKYYYHTKPSKGTWIVYYNDFSSL
jgi:hypothetical protein